MSHDLRIAMASPELDLNIRRAVFDWLEREVAVHGDVLARNRLEEGVSYQGKRIYIIGPQGIFKPQMLDIPISITTVPNGPYSDRFDPRSSFLLYSYRGTNREHPDNRGLREAMRRGIPLVYFFGILPGRYLPVWPVFIQEDYPSKLTFQVSVDQLGAFREGGTEQAQVPERW